MNAECIRCHTDYEPDKENISMADGSTLAVMLCKDCRENLRTKLKALEMATQN